MAEPLDRARDQAVKCASYFGRVLAEHEHKLIAVRKGDTVFVAARADTADLVQEAVENIPLIPAIKFDTPSHG